MTMTDKDHVDAVLHDVAGVAPRPDDALMARVLADAARVQDAPVQAAPRPGIWAQISAALGGWPAMSGVALAGVAGLWVGMSPPAAIEDAAASIFGVTDAVSFLDAGAVMDLEGLSDG